MERQVIAFTTEEAWLAERVKDLTSSDIPVLFGVGYQSIEDLIFQKSHPEKLFMIATNERMDWGRALESAIAQEFARRNEWNIIPKKEYIRIPSLRLGSSFDWQIIATESGSSNTILEIKNVSIDSYKTWIKGFQIDMSPYIELQVQHQMLVSGIDKCIVGALIGGCEGKLIQREANPKIQNAILAKAKQFWQAIDQARR